MGETSQSGQKWQLLGLGVTGFSALCTVLAALIGAGFFVGHVTAARANPAATVTVTVTASPGTTGAASAPIYYQGGVTINSNTLDFDSKPPGPGPHHCRFLLRHIRARDSVQHGRFCCMETRRHADSLSLQELGTCAPHHRPAQHRRRNEHLLQDRSGPLWASRR